MYKYCKTDESVELYLYCSNTAKVWSRLEDYFRLMERKRAKGIYNTERAIQGLCSNYMLPAAHEYSRELSTGSDGPAMFPPMVRTQVASEIVDNLENEWSAGNFWSVQS